MIQGLGDSPPGSWEQGRARARARRGNDRFRPGPAGPGLCGPRERCGRTGASDFFPNARCTTRTITQVVELRLANVTAALDLDACDHRAVQLKRAFHPHPVRYLAHGERRVESAIATGNAFIIKPSERDPSVPVRLAELFIEAGLPEGICQVVHGDKEMVDAILDHPAIGAVSFVGSSDIAHYVYNRGVANGKRVQAMGGAKNHGIVMPDADLDQVVNDLAGAAFGSAGERCMALPVVVPVGDDTAERLKAKLIPAIQALRVGVSTDAEAHYGPVVTAQHKAKVEGWIQTCVDEGGELIIDGRGFKLQGHEEGYFIGPTLFDHVTTDMESYKEEIFGPVLQIVRAANFEEALALPSKHQYGNGVAIFTRNGRAAREFAARVNVGMVGINVPIPVPVAYHSFGGWKRSAFGDTNQHGMEGVKFWTKVKTITQRWPDGSPDGGNAFVIPTMG